MSVVCYRTPVPSEMLYSSIFLYIGDQYPTKIIITQFNFILCCAYNHHSYICGLSIAGILIVQAVSQESCPTTCPTIQFWDLVLYHPAAARSAVIMNCHTSCKENEDNVATKKLLTTGSKNLIENCKISWALLNAVHFY